MNSPTLTLAHLCLKQRGGQANFVQVQFAKWAHLLIATRRKHQLTVESQLPTLRAPEIWSHTLRLAEVSVHMPRNCEQIMKIEDLAYCVDMQTSL